MSNNVAGNSGRRCNGNNVEGDFCRRRCNGNNVEGDFGRRRCDFVYECLEELLEEVLGERNRRRCDCDFVYECLAELLEDVLGESGNNHHHHCCHRD